MGISQDVAAEALAEVFGELDERALIGRRSRSSSRPARRRSRERTADQYLMRQGSPADRQHSGSWARRRAISSADVQRQVRLQSSRQPATPVDRSRITRDLSA